MDRVRSTAEPRFTPGAVRFLRMRRRADCGKAKTELGYRPTTIAQAVRDAYDCFVRRGVITRSMRRHPRWTGATPAADSTSLVRQRRQPPAAGPGGRARSRLLVSRRVRPGGAAGPGGRGRVLEHVARPLSRQRRRAAGAGEPLRAPAAPADARRGRRLPPRVRLPRLDLRRPGPARRHPPRSLRPADAESDDRQPSRQGPLRAHLGLSR